MYARKKPSGEYNPIMSDTGITLFDVGSALPWVEEKIRRLFGKDAATLEQKTLLKQLHEIAVEMTRSVQCIGMSKPISFEKIYQPTRLRVRSGFRISDAAAFQSQNRQAQAIALAVHRSSRTCWFSVFGSRKRDYFRRAWVGQDYVPAPHFPHGEFRPKSICGPNNTA